jgi:hypothetical protein
MNALTANPQETKIFFGRILVHIGAYWCIFVHPIRVAWLRSRVIFAPMQKPTILIAGG